MLGTVIVMLGGPGIAVLAPGVGPMGIALATGIAVAVAIAVIGAVANPMFSLALYLARGITKRELFSDWVGQLVGGLLGGLMIFGLNDLHRVTAGFNGYQPANHVDRGVDLGINTTGFASLGLVLAAELLLGTIVVVVLLKSIMAQPSNATTGALVGATYVVAMMLLSEIDGGGINPARSLGMALFGPTDPSSLWQVWPFVVTPFVASFVGMVIWLSADDATIDDTVFDDTALERASDTVTGDR